MTNPPLRPTGVGELQLGRTRTDSVCPIATGPMAATPVATTGSYALQSIVWVSTPFPACSSRGRGRQWIDDGQVDWQVMGRRKLRVRGYEQLEWTLKRHDPRITGRSFSSFLPFLLAFSTSFKAHGVPVDWYCNSQECSPLVYFFLSQGRRPGLRCDLGNVSYQALPSIGPPPNDIPVSPFPIPHSPSPILRTPSGPPSAPAGEIPAAPPPT